MTVKEYAQLYGRSERQIKRYKRDGLPLDNEAAMRSILGGKVSHVGRRKGLRKTQGATLTTTAQILPPAPTNPETEAALSVADSDSTLARLVFAEKMSYRRYIDSGGDAREALVWKEILDQKRKLESEAAKHATDVSEAETKLVQAVMVVLEAFQTAFQVFARIEGVNCEGLNRFQIQAKLQRAIDVIVNHAVMGITDVFVSQPSLRSMFISPQQGRTMREAGYLFPDDPRPRPVNEFMEYAAREHEGKLGGE
jgi:hypothetical protein